MSWLQLSDISRMMRGNLQGRSCAVDRVCTDSRQVIPKDLFIALPGPHFDGHDFVNDSIAKGASAVVVSRQLHVAVPHIVVADTMHALQGLARAWRQRLNLLFIALTGSNGKTTCKEMLTAIFSRCRRVWSSYGNQNNHLGVALTMLGVRSHHQVAVFELGANHPGEIATLSAWVKPHIALLLNAGAAHLAGFGSLRGVAQAKGEIFTSLADDGIGILNRDDTYYPLWRQQLAAKKIISFGFHPAAQLRAVHRDNQCCLVLQEQSYPLHLSLLGEHNCRNAAAAAAVAHAAGVSNADIVAGLHNTQAVAGRLCQCRGPKGSCLLDDSYNANPDSVLVALQVLSQSAGEHWLALGDMSELGDDSRRYHRQLGTTIRQQGVRHLLTVGSLAREASRSFGLGAKHFDTLEELAAHVSSTIHRDVTLLVKGSRAAAMDRLVARLSQAEASSC